MDCNKAGKLMMSYMDKNITTDEESKLHHHVSKCDACREEFAVYQDLEVEEETFLNPEVPCTVYPSDFEGNVMNKIFILSERSEKNFKLVFGVYSTMFSLLVAAVLLTIDINYTEMALALTNFVGFVFSGVTDALHRVVYQSVGYIFELRYYVMSILVVLSLLYSFIQIREKIRLRPTN